MRWSVFAVATCSLGIGTIADRSGSRLVGVRSIEYPEVVVYEQRVRR